MGTFEEMQAELGTEFFTRPSRAKTVPYHWVELCVCGHQFTYHSMSTGGGWVVPSPETVTMRGESWTKIIAFHGCTGALKSRSFEAETVTADREKRTTTMVKHPTCPCVQFQPVVKVDRPNRYFNQRIPQPAERGDFTRHPFQVGIRAFSTHLSRRRAALSDPDWPAAEFNRRFIWLDGARVCGISKCDETDGVYPVYVDGNRSELRCPAHR